MSTIPDRTERLNAAFSQLKGRAEQAGLTYEDDVYGPNGKYRAGKVTFPAGNDGRVVLVTSSNVENFLKVDFEDYIFTSRFRALLNTKTGLAEAPLAYSPSLRKAAYGDGLTVWELPGATDDPTGGLTDVSATGRYDDSPPKWRLSVASEEVKMELSPISVVWKAIEGDYGFTGTTLKLIHSSGPTGPHVDDLLAELAEPWLFDLDLMYHADVRLSGADYKRFVAHREPSRLTPSFPTNDYAAEAITLYNYGSEARGFPLIQFLAYYQVLEFFFAQFSRIDVARRLRAQMMDPSFDLSDDGALSRLIDITAGAHRGYTGERAQLRAVIGACYTTDELLTVLSDPHLVDHFKARTPAIRGVKRLNLDAADLPDQVAERIYAIRCRVVHTKDSDVRDERMELLLPTARETSNLGPEIELVKRIAQRAIVTGSRPRTAR